MKQILVCEDETSIREFVVINLKRAGYEVIEAGSGEDALQRFDETGGDGWVCRLPGTALPQRFHGHYHVDRAYAGDGKGGRPDDGGG